MYLKRLKQCSFIEAIHIHLCATVEIRNIFAIASKIWDRPYEKLGHLYTPLLNLMLI